MTKINISENIYNALRKHLFAKKSEQVTFLFMERDNDSNEAYNIIDYFNVPSGGLVHESKYHVEITQETQAKVIKMAWDRGAHLGEIHTHPLPYGPTSFSYSDVVGFKEFVPHVWWRLKGGPYLAMVFGENDFDALIWIDGHDRPEKIKEIKVGEKILIPNNLLKQYE